MSNEIATIERWLYSVLTGDVTLTGLVGARVYGHFVPEGAAMPYLFWTMQAPGEDVMTVNATRIWTTPLYTVRIVDDVESFIALETGAAAIDAALHRADGSNVSGTIIGCVRERPFAMPEFRQDGGQLRHLGGQYRIFVQ